MIYLKLYKRSYCSLVIIFYCEVLHNYDNLKTQEQVWTLHEPSNPSQNDASENKIESSSQESYSSEFAENAGTLHSDLKQDSDAKMCLLCCERPANGTIIHAHSKYAHTISCYPCAKKLQHQKKRCPICRRRIHRVVCSVSS